MVIDVDTLPEIECLVAVLSLGLCTALENKGLTVDEASSYLFVPYTISLLKQVGASPELVHLIHLGTELEDFESLLPERLPDRLNTMKALAASVLQAQPELGKHEYKEHWLQNIPRPAVVSIPDPLQVYPPDKMVTRDEKLYRMLMTAYDEHGDPFWGFVQELFLINYWNNPIPDADAEMVYQATVPEAQELLRELLRRGFVYAVRIYGYPPPSSERFMVAQEELQYVVADTQNWLGPLVEGPSALYYRFCSAVPSEAITRDHVVPGAEPDLST